VELLPRLIGRRSALHFLDELPVSGAKVFLFE
jgi:hypothetical protein